MKTFLWGEEDFLLWEKVNFLKDEFLKKNPQARIDVIDFGESFDVNKIVEKLHQGGGLFSSSKLFIGKNVFSISEANQDKMLKIAKDNDQVEMVLIQIGKIGRSKQTKLYKFLKKNFEEKEFAKLGSADLKKFIIRTVSDKSEGEVEIAMEALETLFSVSQGNLWFLKNEIEKLINFIGDRRKIKKGDVEEVSCGKTQSKIFDLVDAVGRRDKRTALSLVASLLSQGENAFYVFTMMVFQIRNLVKIFDFRLEDPSALARRFKMHPFVVKKAQAQTRSFSKKELRRIYQIIAQIDYEMKVGDLDAEKALYDFVVMI